MSQKSQLAIVVALVLLALMGGYFWFSSRETPDTGVQKLSAQNIEINEANFLKEVREGHQDNIHSFFLTGATPGLQDENGVSGLMAAVESGNKPVIAQLLAALPQDPNTAAQMINLKDNTAGRTALRMAVEKNDGDTVNQLLARGADVAAFDKVGQTPLIVAAKSKFAGLLPALIQADQQQHQGNTINLADTSGETPLTYAIRAQDQNMVATLLASKADGISADRSGVTPLMVAAEVGDEAIGAKLLAAGAKPDMADQRGNTPLIIALRHSHPAFARFLLDKGADPDFHMSGMTPLQAAVSMTPFDADFFAYLISRSKQTGAIDPALLYDAIDRKNEGLARVLIEHGVNVKATNAKGETLLYHAIESELETTALLLIDKGTDINQTGLAGITLLERATKHNEVKVVQKLLSLGVSPDQKTSEGYTLAEMAVYSGHPEVLDAFLANGAKIEKDFGILWSIRDGHGKAVPVLLKYGAHPNVMSNSGDPALWLAASNGEVEAVTALIQDRAVIDTPNTSQLMTPLAIASHTGQLPVVKLLVESGARIEAADAFGMTPLAHAAYMAKPEVVEYLISKGANVRAADKQGRGVADLAALGEASADRDKVLTLLQQKR